MSKRIMGKASFIEIQDSKGRIQVYVSRDDIQAPVAEGEQPTTVEQQMYNVVFKKLLTARYRRFHRYRRLRFPYADG